MGWKILYIGSAFQVRLRSRALQFPETSNGQWRGKLHAVSTVLIIKGQPFNIRGGGADVFVVEKLFISTRRAIFFSKFYHVYIEHIEQKLFIYRRVCSKLYNSKILRSPPPQLEFKWCPPYAMVPLPGCISHMNEV